MTRARTIFTTLAASLAGLAGGAWWLLRRSLPQTDGMLTLEGLLDEVEIIRDRWGVPHIYAETAHDLFFGQGFVHAQDRLWEMDFQRRLAAGRLSEVLGETTLEIDRWMRVLGLRWQVEVEMKTVSDEARRALQAYTKGVNRFIETTPVWPVEFALLRYEPEPWTPADSLSWGKMMAFGLSENWDSEIIRARLIDRLGPERAWLLEGGYPADNPVIVPEIDYASLGESALIRKATADPFAGDLGASNSWVVDGTRSTTGKPLLANDPHLLMRIPGIWYENHLVGAGYYVAGASLPGVPAVIVGHNERIAWGLTAALADVQDLYVERFHPDDPHLYQVNGEWRPAEVRREEIRVRGRRKPVIEEVIITRHGPVVTHLAPDETQPLALQWSGYDMDAKGTDCFLKLNRARNWEEVLQALEDHSVPVLNVTYADVDGNIGYRLAGKIPVRRNGDGQVPVPGWTDEYEWRGYLAFDELPRSYNPESGFIVTANNKPVGDDYPHNLGSGWRPGFRARRIVQLIQARAHHDRTSYEAMQVDQLSIPMRRLARRLARMEFDDPQLQAAQADLSYWDGVMGKDAVGATLAYTTMVHFRRALFAEELGPLTGLYLGKGFHPFLHPISGTAARNIEVALAVLDDPDATWLNGRPLDELLTASFRAAVDQLKRELGLNMSRWRWGAVNQLHLIHPLGMVRPLGRLFNRGPCPAGGDPFTVWPNAARFHPYGADFHSASFRLIVDLSDMTRSVAVCPPGQSGHPASPHYADQLPEWQAGRYHTMLWRREAIEAASEGILKLQPAPWGTEVGQGERARQPVSRFGALVEAGRRLRKQPTSDEPENAGLPPELAYEAPEPEYAYTVFWVNHTREWDDDRRRAISDALDEVLGRPDFEANPMERRYDVAGLEGQYSGLSLAALSEVLRAWQDTPAVGDQ
ncbi:MAG: penicillin acylase family protein [Anaerolineae bacterium]